MMDIRPEAQTYLRELLAKQEQEKTGIRIFVAQPGTPHAETCIAYCRLGEQEAEDIEHTYEGFTAWFDGRSESYLKDAVVDFQQDQLGGQLTIRAPNARIPNVSADSPLADRINYILYNEINPGLAAHGGMVSLAEVIEGSGDDKDQGAIAVLQFGGGCQGCSAVDITLKESVEKTLIERCPELSSIRDITDHTDTDNAYYR